MHRRAAVPLIVAALLLAGCDWTQVGFDNVNSGNNNTETTLTLANVTGLHQAWSAPGPSTGTVWQMLVAGGRVVANDGELDAFDPQTGDVIWNVTTEPTTTATCPSPWSGFPGPATNTRVPGTLTVVGSSVYGERDMLVCPGAPPGIEVDEIRSLSDGSVTGPDPVGGAVVVGPDGTQYRAGGGQVSGGAVHISGAGPSDPLSIPIVTGDALYTADFQGALYKVSTTDGSVLWNNGLAGLGGGPRPSTDGTFVYLTEAEALFAFDPATGDIVWYAQLGEQLNGEGATIGRNGLLYVGGTDHVYALDAATGAVVWSGAVPETVVNGVQFPNRPIVANGVVYATTGSQLTMFDAAGVTGCSAGVCTPVATVSLPAVSRTSPVVSGGAVYVGSGGSVIKLVPSP